MADAIYFKKHSWHCIPVTRRKPHRLRITKLWFPDKPATFSLHIRLSILLDRKTLLFIDSQITTFTNASENWTRQSHFNLYIAKMPFALSLCRRCSYSFTTSSGLSKDAATVISQYNRTTRKQCSHILEDLRFGPPLANLIPPIIQDFLYQSREN